MPTPLIPSTPTDVCDLSIEQSALLWCMRLWVAGRLGAKSATGGIERMAAQLDAAEAGPFIEGFMAAINRGTVRSIEIGCLRCPKVGADEQLLLETLGLVQERRFFEALLALRPLVDGDAARAAMQNAEGVGLALARVGRFLPAPEGEGFELARWLMAAP